MNRKEKRELYAKNLRMIKSKQKSVAKIQAKAFLEMAKIIIKLYPSTGVPQEEIELLIDKKHENEELQEVFTKYKEAKHAGVYLSMMLKELKENGVPEEKPKTKADTLGVNITKSFPTSTKTS